MNKNSKQRFKAAQKAAVHGNHESVLETMHNQTSVKRTVRVAQMGKDGVVSSNPMRNMRMKVLHNRGEKVTGNCSLTVHEPIDKNKPFFPKKRRDVKRVEVAVSVGEERA